MALVPHSKYVPRHAECRRRESATGSKRHVRSVKPRQLGAPLSSSRSMTYPVTTTLPHPATQLFKHLFKVFQQVTAVRISARQVRHTLTSKNGR